MSYACNIFCKKFPFPVPTKKLKVFSKIFLHVSRFFLYLCNDYTASENNNFKQIIETLLWQKSL